MIRSVAAVLILVAAPVAAQVGIDNPQTSTPTTLYFHLDAGDDFPVNTQPPDDRYEQADTVGLSGVTTSCIPDPSGQLGFVSQAFHSLYGFSTPGYVEYDFSEQGGPRIHPERGLAGDVLLDTDAPARLLWYMETQVLGDSRHTPPETETVPVVVPEVTVEATLREGDDISVGATAYNAGAVLASGASVPMTVWPDPSNPYYHELPDGKHLYEFEVPLDLAAASISKRDAFNIRIDMRLEAPGCDEDPEASLMTSNMRVHTSPAFRPRLEWSVTNPLAIEYIHPQIVGDSLVIHTAMSSPWGNYDVDESPQGTHVRILGPSPAASLTRTAFVQRHHEHNAHFEPVDVTYSWPFGIDGAADGDYVIEVRARNDQATAEAVGRARFEIGANIGVDSDGNRVEQVRVPDAKDTPVPLGLAALLAAALWLRHYCPNRPRPT